MRGSVREKLATVVLAGAVGLACGSSKTNSTGDRDDAGSGGAGDIGGSPSGGSSPGGTNGNGGSNATGGNATGGSATGGSGGASGDAGSAGLGAMSSGGSAGLDGGGSGGMPVSCNEPNVFCPPGYSCTCKQPNNPNVPADCTCHKLCESADDCTGTDSLCGCGPGVAEGVCVSNCFCLCG